MDKGFQNFSSRSSDEHNGELISTFSSECEELVASLESTILDLEIDLQDKEKINAAFRFFHTLKGSSKAVGLKIIPNLTHYAESFLHLVREQETTLDEDKITLLLELMTCLKEINQNMKTEGKEGERNYFNVLAKFEELLEDTQNTEGNKTEASSHETENLQSERQHTIKEEKYIKVDHDQIEHAMLSMGDLLLVRNQFKSLGDLAKKHSKLSSAIRDLELTTTDLQRRISHLRLSSLESLFTGMRRVVRSAAIDCGKEIRFSTEGQDTMVDRKIIESIREPLIHMLRNAVDHGIESIEQRKEANKDPVGSIKLNAFFRSGEIFITVIDDGGGLNTKKIIKVACERGVISEEDALDLKEQEAYQLLFEPGFSTKSEVSTLSGRGVGMDVVKSKIESVRGRIEIQSKINFGSTFIIRLPLSLSLIESIFFTVGEDQYSIPLSHVVEVFSPNSSLIKGNIEKVLNSSRVMHLRDEVFPIISLAQEFKSPEAPKNSYILVEHSLKRFIIEVAEIQGTSSAYIQPLEESLHLKGPFTGVSKDVRGTPVLQVDLSLLSLKIQSHVSERKKAKSLAGTLVADAFLSDMARLRQKIILFRCQELFGIPVQKAEQITYAYKNQIKRVGEGKYYVDIEGETFEIIWPNRIFNNQKEIEEQDLYWLVISKQHTKKYALLLTHFQGVRPMPQDYQEVDYHSCILGSAKIEDQSLLIVDIDAMIAASKNEGSSQGSAKYNQSFVLVVEDEPFFRSNIVSFLKSQSYEVAVSEDGQDAINVLEQCKENPLAIITDIEMPNMDGIQLTSWLRSQTQYKSTPIIALSAISHSSVIKKAYAAGVDNWISKMDHYLVKDELEKVRNQTFVRLQDREAVQEKSEAKKLISFYCGKHTFALPMESVREVGVNQATAKVPINEQILKGVTNYKGRIIPCLDYAEIFELDNSLNSAKRSAQEMRIIIDLGNEFISLVVSGVGRVIAAEELVSGEGLYDIEANQFKDLIERVYLDQNQVLFLMSRTSLRNLVSSQYKFSFSEMEAAS